MDYLLFMLGFLLGFIFWKLFAGKHEGDKLERSFRFSVGDYYVHIHHWIWTLAILAVLLVIQYQNLFILGILAGSFVQGLTYKDRLVILYHKDKFSEIYSKFKSL